MHITKRNKPMMLELSEVETEELILIIRTAVDMLLLLKESGAIVEGEENALELVKICEEYVEVFEAMVAESEFEEGGCRLH